MHRLFSTRCIAVFLAAASVLFCGCADDPTSAPGTGMLTVEVGFDEPAALSIEDASGFSRVLATADGRDTSARVQLTPRGPSWTGTIDVPAGAYTVTLEAFDKDVRTRSGSETTDVVAGLPTSLLVRLTWLVPEKLTATSREEYRPPDSADVTLTWVFSQRDRWQGFVIQRRMAHAEQFQDVAQLPSSARSHRDTSVSASQAYHYRIAAIDSTGLPGSWSVPDTVQAGVFLPHSVRMDDVEVLPFADDLDLSRLSTETKASWIAFGGNDGVYVVRPDGSDAIWVGPGVIAGWSPTGRFLGVQSASSASVYAPADEQLHALPTGKLSAWSPTGDRVLLEDNSHVRMVHVETGEQITLAAGRSPRWSPDGRWVAFNDTARPPPFAPPRVVRLDLETGEQTDWFDGGMLGFSPDSQWMLYSYGGGGYFDYHATRVNGSEDRALGGSYSVHVARWMPDGTAILASASEDEIALYTMDGGRTRAARGLPHFEWSAPAQRLAFTMRESMFSNEVYLHTSELYGAGERRITPMGTMHPFTTGRFAWAPDGSLLAAIAPDDAGIRSLYLIDPMTGSRRRIAEATSVAWSAR